jgi:Domain of unknown function (DUF4192)
MNATSDRPPVQVSSPAAVLAVVPHLLGFVPETSLVVLGAGPPRDRVQVAIRYDMPDPPDTGFAAEIAAHAVGVLGRQHLPTAIVAGYGPGPLVTPLVDAIRAAARNASVELREILRVHEGRYWSYLCRDPACCPVEGVAFDAAAHPAAAALAAATKQPVLAGRDALAAAVAPLTGAPAAAMADETRRAKRTADRLLARAGRRAFIGAGLSSVQAAIQTYRDGGAITRADRHAWLAFVLTSLWVRDDAWARMDPAHRDAHRRLWTDLMRRAQPGYVAAPACLLAFTAWQCGDGALANVALDRAVADTPGYSMALLLREALAAGVPPSAARVPMTPEQVAASYQNQAGGQAAEDDDAYAASPTSDTAGQN